MGRKTCSSYTASCQGSIGPRLTTNDYPKSERDDSQVATRKQLPTDCMISNVPSLQSPDPHNLHVNRVAGLFFGLSSARLALVCVSNLRCTPPDPDGYTRHVREATTKSHPIKGFRYVQHETAVPTVVSSLGQRGCRCRKWQRYCPSLVTECYR